jgi:hypothetical protein
MLLFEWASRIETAGYKLAEGKGLREGWDSKELWKSVEKVKSPVLASGEGCAARGVQRRNVCLTTSCPWISRGQVLIYLLVFGSRPRGNRSAVFAFLAPTWCTCNVSACHLISAT